MATGKSIYFNPRQTFLLEHIAEVAAKDPKFKESDVQELLAIQKKARNMLSAMGVDKEEKELQAANNNEEEEYVEYFDQPIKA